MEVLLSKQPGGVLVAMDEGQADTLKQWPNDALVRCKVTRVRNPRFHRKFFALLTVGFEAFEPVREYKGYVIEKNFDAFRDDIIIMAGYYIATYRPDGVMRLRPKSIAFSKMDEDTFADLYNKVATVLLNQVLTRYNRAELDRVIVKRLEGF
jgi:hypothetical protein